VANHGARWCPAAAVIVALVAGCHSGSGTPVTTRLRVGAQPYALAEVARRVGGHRVVVGPVGDVRLTVSPSDPDPWLDPVAMEQVTQVAADTLSRADPAGRSSYQSGARAYRAQLGALDINYRSSLADCARHDIVTADGAFARLGRSYGFTDHPASDAGVAAVVRTKGIGVVFSEVGVAPGPVDVLAQATHTRVDQLDTLATVDPEQQARGATYLSVMADNLAKLRSALSCTSGP
jgi:ABC-type Zn uptake system ZnuABC Zn-binding protein ZnuA